MTDQIQAARTRGTLALVVCTAASGRIVQKFVVLAQADGWDVWVVATPNVRSAFIDLPLSLLRQALRSSLMRVPFILEQTKVILVLKTAL